MEIQVIFNLGPQLELELPPLSKTVIKSGFMIFLATIVKQIRQSLNKSTNLLVKGWLGRLKMVTI